MARGGYRPGAGRKPGAATKLDEMARQRAAATGELPLDFLLKAMRDECNEFAVRLDAAKAAAPYIHARLSSVEQKSTVEMKNVVALPERAPSTEAWQAKVSTQH